MVYSCSSTLSWIFSCALNFVWQLYSELWAFWVQHRVITGAFRICFECVFLLFFVFCFFKLCRYINKERKTYFTYTHSILTAVADCDWQSWFTVTRCSRLFNLLLCWICHFWLITVNQTLMCQSDRSIDQSLSLTELVLTVASLILLVSSSCLRFLRLI